MNKFAIISFPGTNCETETVRAFKRAGMEAEIVLWNEKSILDRSRVDEFVGYCIPGGFSYEDRGRSAVVAAQEPITEILKEEADAGKVILGICNGAQVLVETGLVPGFDNKALGMGLGWNEMKIEQEVVDTGFRNQWIYLKNTAPKTRSAFNDFDDLIQTPIANGEGRYVIEPELLKQLEANNQILFKYCDADGNVNATYPITPNGAVGGIAGICNPAGNVMAIMPHPERDPLSNGQLIFESIKRYLDVKPQSTYQSLGVHHLETTPTLKKQFDLEIYVRLIITDNTERTIEEALIRKGFQLHLDRYEFFGITLGSDVDPEEALEKIMNAGEVANFNKHLVYAKIKGTYFQYKIGEGLLEADLNFAQSLLTTDDKNFMGLAKKQSLNARMEGGIDAIESGVFWNITQADSQAVEQVIASHVLHNPYSMTLYTS